MTRKKAVLGGVIGLALALSGTVVAQRPVDNVNPGHHPNLAAAQRLSSQAFQRVLEAQRANEFDMDGHAQRAKELLDQVNHELSMAAHAANKNR
jgi:hypothetical protein